MFETIVRFFRRQPVPTVTVITKKLWEDNACRKCGIYFFSRNTPKITYSRSAEHGEALKCECPRCGFFWFVPPVTRD
jgi:hypothetical protein